jgi:hypothetical protein
MESNPTCLSAERLTTILSGIDGIPEMTVEGLLTMLSHRSVTVESIKKRYPGGVKLYVEPCSYFKCEQTSGTRPRNLECQSPKGLGDPLFTFVTQARGLKKENKTIRELTAMVEKYQRLMAKYRWMFDSNSAETVKIWLMRKMNNRAITLYDNGRLMAAAEQMSAVVRSSRRLFGDDHPETLWFRNNWAGMLISIDRIQEGKDEFFDLQRVANAHMKNTDLECLITRNYFGVTYCKPYGD